MKKITKRIALSLFLLSTGVITYAQSLFVGSYNIRYKNNDDAKAGFVWQKRCQVICDQLKFENPDIFGAQEVLVEQLHDMLQ